MNKQIILNCLKICFRVQSHLLQLLKDKTQENPDFKGILEFFSFVLICSIFLLFLCFTNNISHF